KGCLSGCLVRIVGTIVAGSLVTFIFMRITAPWAFHLGGESHTLPYWQGVGTMHAPEGNYIVLMGFGPWTGRRRTVGVTLSGPSVTGSGSLCSPHGEIYKSLRVHGSFINRGIGADTDGEPMWLGLQERLNFIGSNSDTRISVNFRGKWNNPDLELDDHGSLRRMFNPDGSRWSGKPSKRPEPGAPLELILHPGSRSEFDQLCAAAQAKKKAQ